MKKALLISSLILASSSAFATTVNIVNNSGAPFNNGRIGINYCSKPFPNSNEYCGGQQGQLQHGHRDIHELQANSFTVTPTGSNGPNPAAPTGYTPTSFYFLIYNNDSELYWCTVNGTKGYYPADGKPEIQLSNASVTATLNNDGTCSVS